MSETFSFGAWMAQRRKTLDITQRELAAQINCALATSKKIELDERRPSRDLAEALADALHIPADSQHSFVECARGLRLVDALASMKTISHDRGQRSTSPIARDLPASVTPLIGRGSSWRRLPTCSISPPAAC